MAFDALEYVIAVSRPRARARAASRDARARPRGMGCSKCRYSERGCARCVSNFVSSAVARAERANGAVTTTSGTEKRATAVVNSNRTKGSSGSKRAREDASAREDGAKRRTSAGVGKSARASLPGSKTPGVKTPAERISGGGLARNAGESTDAGMKTSRPVIVRALEQSESEDTGDGKPREGDEESEVWEDAPKSGGRVLFEDCDVPSPKPIEEMSPGVLESVIAKSPSALLRMGTGFISETPPSPLAAAFAMISEFLETPKRERLRETDFWGLTSAAR